MYKAEMLCHSVAPNGKQMDTMIITVPQMIEQELLRHRSFSFSFGSTRAIPIAEQLRAVMEDPVIPISWGRAGKGMQAREELSHEERKLAIKQWLDMRDEAVATVLRLAGHAPVNEKGDPIYLKVHKQIAGRLLQPWAWRTGIMTATDWNQFFLLRCHGEAQPEIQPLAYMCLRAYLHSTPRFQPEGTWHLPYVTEEEKHNIGEADRIKLSVGRCAWVSFRPYGAEDNDPKRDQEAAIKKCNDLISGSGGVGHWSPMEHQGRACGYYEERYRSGNLNGFVQYRSLFHNQNMESLITREDLVDMMRKCPAYIDKEYLGGDENA